MSIVKFVISNSRENDVFRYIVRENVTEPELIDGIHCSPDTALEEFLYVKQHFHKEVGRQYYHMLQAFSPKDPTTQAMAHEIGKELAMYFDGYQVVVVNRINKPQIHNHIIINSVSLVKGKKLYLSRNDMLQVREYSKQLCCKRGLFVSEGKCDNP